MRATLLSSAAVLALTAATVIGGAAPASAAPIGLVAGGGWPGFFTGPPYGQEYTSPSPYRPAAPGLGVANGGAASCAARFRSYDPSSGTYLGFDGVRHPCR